MNLLIVEDEKKLAKILKKGLEEAGFYVDISNDGEEGLYMATEYKYNAIILDINLPKINGLEILENIRKNNIILPVLILTAMGETSDKIKGLNIGADDYMSKPFDFDELLARLYALIRRSKGNPNPIVIIKNLEINLNNKTIRKDNNEIKLSFIRF
jgi:DNA-binding response OmpR family regulator